MSHDSSEAAGSDPRRLDPRRSTERGGPTALAAFRGDQRASLPLHPLEKAVVWIAALQVCSLPWMLGSMRPWAQLIGFGLALLAFACSLLPRTYAGDYSRHQAFTLYPWRKLIRWPLWWLGLLFFTYVLTQALNPAWEFVQKETTWVMRRIDHIAWLPTGMRTPFAMMNPWRQMMIWGAPFLLACALWIGLTRRKAVIALLTAIVVNATILAVIGIVARYTANGMILWLVEGRRNYAFSAFTYKNHAGSFFALTAAITLALAVYAHRRAARRQLRSSPASLLVFASMILMVAVLLSYSRAAIIILAAFLAVLALVGVVRLLFIGGLGRAPLALALFAIGLTLFGVVGSKLVNSERTLDRLSRLTDTEKIDSSVLSRSIAWQAGLDMASEHPAYGWGAGGFRYLFPRYQRAHPEILWADQRRQRGFMFWQHAHNDYLQFLIETGRVGLGLMLLGLLLALGQFIRQRGLRHLPALTLLGAGFVTLAHAAVDFPLQNPAILATLATTLTLALILPAQEPRRA